ncbi:MAG: prolyl-tRNA synthetase [Candidatus Doudnabacteria bacterium CG10_big_fil_rev_8_21_14_0_10_41_10]|uniref:Proline--tRNA ligase n=1 Tax=Candidatus Doudnabacteria bacterium CG10_big_fil_rev_8_21_14_0_10_41_10 TaxID=1974551 RepID=A0A2H0VCB1_9BACT|nr:MAG: prolyl-tRNA synthetase [Candidatus Doudnabacteria bacterium CG10_big_fil_rev_8_21_14_0_10_41_10]
MLQSQLFTKTSKDAPKDEVSINAKLLSRGGFVDKTMAGVYSILPLGNLVLSKIENIVRQELNAIGAQELLMPALQPKEIWKKTGRWNDLDVLFKVTSRFKSEYALGPTHEEVLVPVAQKFISSYKDMPISVYQIQTKFRDEARAKSGLLRGREFRMKDLYSFHTDEQDLDEYYQKATKAYQNIFVRLGLNSILTEASGGTFSKYSHEFQVEIPTGEDVIFICKKCNYGVNKEISKDGKCPKCLNIGEQLKTSEVGNIFKLNTKYSKPFDFMFSDDKGEKQFVIMGCYGIGTTRALGTIVEVHNDKDGIIWPKAVSPYDVHLLSLQPDDKTVRMETDKIYKALQKGHHTVLYDDRDVRPGVKFADSDLIGIPSRIVISKKTLDKQSVEIKERRSGKVEIIKIQNLKL